MIHWSRVTDREADSAGIWLRGGFRSVRLLQRCGSPL
jgi:hypothetical protein